MISLLAGCSRFNIFASKGIISAQEAKNVVYRLKGGDELEITVWGHDHLNRKAEVREKGTIPFPMIGEIQAAGKSLREVETAIQEKLDHAFKEDAFRQQEALDLPKRIISASEIPSSIYRLRRGDELTVSVWNHNDLNQRGQIREDRTFSFPLIGDVQTAGLSLRGLETEIRKRLNKDYIVNPQVNARLVNAKFTILGQVGRPGSFQTDGMVDLLSALSSSGGVDLQRSSQVDIIRQIGEEKVIIRVHPNLVLQGKEPRIDLWPHDVLYVQMISDEGFQVKVQLLGAKYTVIGEVNRPGSYDMEERLDLLTAVSKAGGINKFGSSNLEIIRGEGEGRAVIRVDLNRVIEGLDPNIAIQPDDTIYVRRRLI